MKSFHKILYVIAISLFSFGCESLRERNIKLYEQEIEAKEARLLPPEPTLAKKRVDDVPKESLFDDDGLNEVERSYMNKIRENDKKEAKKRSKKIFGVFSK